MSTYETGTVAVATVRGVPDVRVFRVQNIDGWVDESGYAHTPEGIGLDTRTPVTDVRPLVVLDVPDPRRLWADLGAAIEACGNSGVSDRLSAVRDHLEPQTKPPRIPEPGLWGVVKARGPLGENESPNEDEWVRTDDIVWRSRVTGWGACWDQLIDPTLVRDGIEVAS